VLHGETATLNRSLVEDMAVAPWVHDDPAAAEPRVRPCAATSAVR
jgi:hypothetical protein